MPLTLAYMIIRSVLSLVAMLVRGDVSKDVELLVLRHENRAAPPGPGSPLPAGGPDLVCGSVPASPPPPLVSSVAGDSRHDLALAPLVPLQNSTRRL